MTEQERFDREIEALCGAMPPRRDLLTVRPWGRAFTWILWGLVLQTVHLGLLGLEFLLPLLGVFLQLPGFRQLRNSGRWFRRCWQLAIVQGIWAAVFVAAVEVTGLALALLAHPPLGYLIASVVGVFKVAQTVFLHLGLREIWRELGQEHPSPVLYLMWFQGLGPAIKLVDALWPGAEQVLFWPWLVLFFLAVRRLWQGARELDQWGYARRCGCRPGEWWGRAFLGCFCCPWERAIWPSRGPWTTPPPPWRRTPRRRRSPSGCGRCSRRRSGSA